ncbi:RDD family protein [Alicyclobacillus curvatus]|nr:RDD family protein [Alicyclobacillus curvatus]
MLDNNLKVHTPEQVRLKLRLAGIGSRVVAQVIDLLILMVVYALFTASEVMWQWLHVFGRATSYLVGAAVVISFLVFWGYFIALEAALSGQTIGKRVMKIRAVGRDGRPLSFYAAAIRNLLRLVDFLPAGYLVGLIVAVIDGQERRLGDLAAGTVVVQDRMGSLWQYSSYLDTQGLGLQDAEDAPRRQDSRRYQDSLHRENSAHEMDSSDGPSGDGSVTSRSLLVSVPKSSLQVQVNLPLPGEWTQFLSDLGPRLRGLSKARRDELLPEVWQNFTALPEVSVHSALSTSRGKGRRAPDGVSTSRGKGRRAPDGVSTSHGKGGGTADNTINGEHEQSGEQGESSVVAIEVTVPEIERFLAAVSRQLRGKRRGRKSR